MEKQRAHHDEDGNRPEGKAGAAFTRTVYGATWASAKKKMPAETYNTNGPN